jgi:hypothetical protein
LHSYSDIAPPNIATFEISKKSLKVKGEISKPFGWNSLGYMEPMFTGLCKGPTFHGRRIK